MRKIAPALFIIASISIAAVWLIALFSVHSAWLPTLGLAVPLFAFFTAIIFGPLPGITAGIVSAGAWIFRYFTAGIAPFRPDNLVFLAVLFAFCIFLGVFPVLFRRPKPVNPGWKHSASPWNAMQAAFGHFRLPPEAANSELYALDWNDGFAELAGKEGVPIPGGTLTECFPEFASRYPEIHRQVLDTAATGRPNRLLSRAAGGERSFRVYLSSPAPGETVTLWIDDTDERFLAEYSRQSEERFRLISENMLDLICLHRPAGAILYATPSAEKLLGYPQNRLFGRDPFPLIHPEDTRKVLRMVLEARKKGGSSAEYRIRRSDGTYVWFETVLKTISGSPGEITSFQSASRDVTEKLLIRHRLEESERKLQAIFDLLPVGVSVSDPDGAILQCNPAYLQILGLRNWQPGKDPLEHLDMLLPDMTPLPPDDHPRNIALRKRQPIRNRHIGYRVENDIHWTQISAAPLPEGGAVSVTVDITPMKHAEKELSDLLADLQRSNEELRRLSITDVLTGLYNRRHIEYVLEVEFEKARRYGSPLTCLMLDIDHFKRFNDSWGHQAGDLILKVLADAIRENSRKVDICGRYGGEEFIMLVNQPLPEATVFAEKLLRVIRETSVEYQGNTMSLTVSIGVADYTEKTLSSDQLVKRSDDALYLAKANGRDRVEVYRLREGN